MYYPLKILSFVVLTGSTIALNQLCPTRGPRAACSPVKGFVRPRTGSTIALNQLCPTAARGPHAAQSKVLCGPV